MRPPLSSVGNIAKVINNRPRALATSKYGQRSVCPTFYRKHTDRDYCFDKPYVFLSRRRMPWFQYSTLQGDKSASFTMTCGPSNSEGRSRYEIDGNGQLMLITYPDSERPSTAGSWKERPVPNRLCKLRFREAWTSAVDGGMSRGTHPDGMDLSSGCEGHVLSYGVMKTIQIEQTEE